MERTHTHIPIDHIDRCSSTISQREPRAYIANSHVPSLINAATWSHVHTHIHVRPYTDWMKFAPNELERLAFILQVILCDHCPAISDWPSCSIASPSHRRARTTSPTNRASTSRSCHRESSCSSTNTWKPSRFIRNMWSHWACERISYGWGSCLSRCARCCRCLSVHACFLSLSLTRVEMCIGVTACVVGGVRPARYQLCVCVCVIGACVLNAISTYIYCICNMVNLHCIIYPDIAHVCHPHPHTDWLDN